MIRNTLMAGVALLLSTQLAAAEESKTFLEGTRHHSTLTSTVTDNGDQNPYAVVVAPAASGIIAKGDVLVGNFNNSTNLQGLGSTIVQYNPTTEKTSLFAQLPRHLEGCPGGIGLTAAMTMLKSGWVIVGSTPSEDGNTTTKGQGCLVVIDSNGKVAKTIAGDTINGPWGNMAVIDNGSTASLFVSNAGFGIGGADTSYDDAVNKATVLRLDLAIPAGKAPIVKKQTVIGDGFGEQADKGVFLIGPTGLALDKNGTLYVSDAVHNSINAIDNAATRTKSAGTGREVTKDNLLHRPLALAIAPNGHLLAVNGLNGQIVEIDLASGKQLVAQWIDNNKAQTPPGSGDLFGFAITPTGDGFYYVEDDVNTLVLAH
jgi:sugar lactone lactonase YvrE